MYLEQSAVTVNTFPSLPEGGPREGSNLQTLLRVTAWIRETHFGANAWIDFHVFDGADRLIHSETLTLPYGGLGSSFRYKFSGQFTGGRLPRPDRLNPGRKQERYSAGYIMM